MRSTFSFLVLVFALSACEGPAGEAGPMGPAGEAGPMGPAGEDGDPVDLSDATVFFKRHEFTLGDDQWDDESSYYLLHSDFLPSTVLAIYVRRFYTNNGDPYHTPLSDYLGLKRWNGDITVQIAFGSVRIFDPNKHLDGEKIVVFTSKVDIVFSPSGG